MIVVLPFYAGDADQLLDLLSFMGHLGGCPRHSALLVADAGVDWATAVGLLEEASGVFRAVKFIVNETHVAGWPMGANSLFVAAATHAKEINEPFLWLESDAIPVRPGWLEDIHAAYHGGFMGHIYSAPLVESTKFLSGVAVYPPDAIDYIGPCIIADPLKGFDVSSSFGVLSSAHHTNLIQHFFGEIGLAPTFGDVRRTESPVNFFTLSELHPEAVLFHRNKDGTLIDLLRLKLSEGTSNRMMVVLPFYNGDAEILIKNLEWMVRMGMGKTHDCLLSFDDSTTKELVRHIFNRATHVFSKVFKTSYRMGHGLRFPQTFAWQHAARAMEQIGRSWLWCEPDMIPLKPNWLTVLQNEYDRCGKPFMGSMVVGIMPMNHLNGTAIYPPNTPALLPVTMATLDNAWDIQMAPEMMHLAHDADNIMHHLWGIVSGVFHPLTGEFPTFPRGSPLLNQIPRTAVVLHRSKDGTLIDRLSEKI
jgi:hypothetical protein